MKRLSVVLFALVLAGLSGCASVKMQDASLKRAPADKKALVTFVRPAIFFGDGASVDLWDGTTFVGSMGAGKMIQYEVEPGKHVFIADAENFSYVDGELAAGKQYFIKANVFPGVLTARCALGVVKSDDTRGEGWLRDLKPTAAKDEARKKVEQERKPAMQKAVADFQAGKVTSTAIQPGDAR